MMVDQLWNNANMDTKFPKSEPDFLIRDTQRI